MSDRSSPTTASATAAPPVRRGFFGSGIAVMIVTPAIGASSVIAAKLSVGEVDPDFMLAVRWIAASLLLMTFSWPHFKKDWPKIRGSLFLLSACGVLGYATYNLLLFRASYFTKGLNLSIGQAAIPTFVLLGNFVIFKVKAMPLQLVGLALAFVGVLVAATHGELARLMELDINIGDGMLLLGCMIYAGYSLMLRWRPDIHWISFMFITSVAAAIASTIYLVVLRNPDAPVIATSLKGWMIIAYVTIFPSILAQAFFARGVDLLGVNRASLFVNLLPIYGAIMSVFILGEHMEPYHFVAAAMVVTGIYLSEMAARNREKIRPAPTP